VAADEVHLVFEGAIRADAAGRFLFRELGDEGPAVRAGGIRQQRLKRDADGPFVEGALMFEFAKRLVVRFDLFQELFGRLGGDGGPRLWPGAL
jgi:hypothetical protein